MADDCKTNEACDNEPIITNFTGNICYDGEELTCENDGELVVLTNDKLNALLKLYFTKICFLLGRVEEVNDSIQSDSFIENVTVDEGTGIITFTSTNGAFNGTVDLSFLLGQNTNDIDYISNITLNSGVLTFTGVGNAFSGSIDLNSINTDDVSYTQNVYLQGTDLYFTGIGSNFNGFVSLASIAGGGAGSTAPAGSPDPGLVGPNSYLFRAQKVTTQEIFQRQTPIKLNFSDDESVGFFDNNNVWNVFKFQADQDIVTNVIFFLDQISVTYVGDGSAGGGPGSPTSDTPEIRIIKEDNLGVKTTLVEVNGEYTGINSSWTVGENRVFPIIQSTPITLLETDTVYVEFENSDLNNDLLWRINTGGIIYNQN